MLKLLSFIVVGFSVANAIHPNQAQEFNRLQADLEACNKFLQTSKAINFDLTYTAFHSHESLVAAEKSKGKYIHESSNTYYTLMGNTFIQTKNCFVIKDDSNKVVLVKKKGEFEDPVLKNVSFDVVKKKITKIKSIQEKQQRVYEIELNDPDVAKLKFYVNLSPTYISRIVLNYKNKIEIIDDKGNKSSIVPRIEVEYAIAHEKSVQNYFDVSRILKKNKNSWQLVGNYKKYKLIDQYHLSNSK